MIVTGNHVPAIPSSDLFDDILRRTSLTDDAYCPIDTEAEPIKKKYLDDYKSTVSLQVDWQFNRGQRIKKMDINKLIGMLSSMTDNSGNIAGDMCFFSRNSDLQRAVLECFTGVCSLYRNKDKNGYRKDVNEFRVQKSVVLQSDDGEEVYLPGELENVDNDVIIDYEKISIAQKIGYYLKMFHEGSKRKGLSMMSFIIAYLKVNHGVAADQRKDNKKYVAQQIYTVDVNGNCVRQYNENHNTSKAWGEQATWFYNRHDVQYQDIYNVHVDEFIELCERAGINLANEDPTDFTADVINNITTTYIMSNMDFVNDYLGKIDSTVFKCLSPDRLLQPGSAVIIPEGDINGCYFMDAFIDEVTEVLNTNYSSDKSFVNKQRYYTREFDTNKLYVSGIPYFYLWYYMADVYTKLYEQKIYSDSYKPASHEALLKDISDIRLKAFRITAGRIFMNPGTTVLEGMVQSHFYISRSDEYLSWRQVDRMTDLALNDYIVLERSVIAKSFNLTPTQLAMIPEKFVVSSYGCIVGQKYSGGSSLRTFDVYDLEKATAFMRGLIYSNLSQERASLVWPDPEVFNE